MLAVVRPGCGGASALLRHLDAGSSSIQNLTQEHDGNGAEVEVKPTDLCGPYVFQFPQEK